MRGKAERAAAADATWTHIATSARNARQLDKRILPWGQERLNQAGDHVFMVFGRKDWDGRVRDAELVAREPGLQALRDRIVELADPAGGEVIVDLGAGTGLLALALLLAG